MARETIKRCRTFRYRLHPTVRQTHALIRQLNYQRELYNAALDERVGAWKWERRSVSYVDQCRALTGLSDLRPEVLTSGTVLRRGTPKAITVKREGTKWWVSVRCVDVPAMPLAPTGREVGIDLGVANLVATSDGERIVGGHFGSRARDQLAQAQRKLSTKQRGSNRRRRQVEEVARLHRRVANQRSNAAHQLSRQLVNDYDLIVVEDLAIVNMVRAPRSKPDPDRPGAFLPNGAASKAGLNRSIHDAGWGANSRGRRNTALLN
jgi:putative transposase